MDEAIGTTVVATLTDIYLYIISHIAILAAVLKLSRIGLLLVVSIFILLKNCVGNIRQFRHTLLPSC